MTEYGPFHRLASRAQTAADARRIARSGELWGRSPWGSPYPQVQAYPGPLPPDAQGIEFYTTARPHPHTAPTDVRWREGDPGVRIDGDHAKIVIRLTRNSQS